MRGIVVTRTAACVCGGAITVVVPSESDPGTKAHEILSAVQRHNRTPAHQKMTRLWESEWLHPYDPGYPFEEVMPE